MKMYTKTGDTGTTALFGGKRVSKHNLRLEAYGTVDELNSAIGVIRAFNKDSQIDQKLEREQQNMLRLGADLATELDAPEKFQKAIKRITEKDIEIVEKEIDDWDSTLPKLTTFILPGGSQVSGFIHVARTICRRAERRVVQLSHSEEINDLTQKYLNRLSDWFFVMGRVL
jgi:cob(I)alamin adenosyltransferase